MAHEVTNLIFDSYKQVKDHFSNNDNCVQAGKYMHIFRVNRIREVRPELDDHIFMAVDMQTGREIDVPRAVLARNKCSDSDNEEIHAIDFFYFDDGDPEDEEDFVGPERPDTERKVIN